MELGLGRKKLNMPEGVSMMPIVVKLPNGNIADPIAKVFKRFHYGDTENIKYFYQVFTITKHQPAPPIHDEIFLLFLV